MIDLLEVGKEMPAQVRSYVSNEIALTIRTITIISLFRQTERELHC
jgi:hypothetical protein